MGDVTTLSNSTRLDIPTERVLAAAGEADLAKVLVLGLTETGEFYFASTSGHKGELLYLIESFRHQLMSGDFG